MTNLDPISCLVLFHHNTSTPTQSLTSMWMNSPPRAGEIVNLVRDRGKEFIGCVAEVVWFIPPGPNNVGSKPFVRVYLDPVMTGSPKVDPRVRGKSRKKS